MQEILFVPESELSQADKTRVAIVSNISLLHALIWLSWNRINVNPIILVDFCTCSWYKYHRSLLP